MCRCNTIHNLPCLHSSFAWLMYRLVDCIYVQRCEMLSPVQHSIVPVYRIAAPIGYWGRHCWIVGSLFCPCHSPFTLVPLWLFWWRRPVRTFLNWSCLWLAGGPGGGAVIAVVPRGLRDEVWSTSVYRLSVSACSLVLVSYHCNSLTAGICLCFWLGPCLGFACSVCLSGLFVGPL